MKYLRHVLCLLLSLPAAANAAGDARLAGPHRTDWFKEAKWGVFMHYMGDTVLKGDQVTVEKLEQGRGRFDAKGLANQLASAGAGYFVLTLGQNSGYYCAPNPTYDRLTGITPSKCARRDLVSDLSQPCAPSASGCWSICLPARPTATRRR